jgi:hypothetical protein
MRSLSRQDDKTKPTNKPTHIMQRKLRTLIKMAACAALALGSATLAPAEDKAASATGTWTWTTAGRGGGGAERKFSLALKQDGEKLTGKLSSPGRDGAATETEIADGSVKGAEISFTVSRERQGTKITTKYTGKIAGDEITGKIESKDRQGNDQSRDWKAKREPAK